MTTYDDHSNRYEGSYAHMFDEQLAAKRKLKQQNKQLQQRVIALEITLRQISRECVFHMGEWAGVAAEYLPNNLLGYEVIRSYADETLETGSPAGEFVTMPKAVAQAMTQALISIDQFAPQEKPEEPDYAALRSDTEVVAAASAYSIALTAWSFAQLVRPALTLAKLAADEPVQDDADIPTVKIEVQAQ